jgi:uncharacterized membrane protein YedE/YeeE
MNVLTQSWHWSFSGFMIAVVMFLLIFLGKKFGVSSSFRATCSALGAGRKIDYFDYDWKSHGWLFLFIGGAIIGGFIADTFMPNLMSMELGTRTSQYFAELGVASPAAGEISPKEIFSLSGAFKIPHLIMLVIGGLLIGFGTRYAGGCTSGHAITGLSNLQLPSLVAVIGFFIGGLTMTHLLLPLILN